ncbi:MAG TPA: Rieske (2Fe-2S) protein [Abditibacteriaceae bacterium]|jgi:cytochrome b6-f complex iron-sulfur subunit
MNNEIEQNHSDNTPTETPDESRRAFLKLAVAGCAGCAALALAGCGDTSGDSKNGSGAGKAGNQGLATAVKTVDGWQVAGAAALTAGQTQQFIAGGEPIFLIGQGNGKVRALSGKCTHLGCAVEWKGEKKEFFCPCHASRFSKDGKVLTGPAEKPLPEFSVTTRGADVVVKVK